MTIQGERLAEYGEQKLKFDPYSLFNSSGFMHDSLQSLRMYHHPDCFANNRQHPSIKLAKHGRTVEESADNDAIEQAVVHQVPTLKMTAHGLDTHIHAAVVIGCHM